MKKPTRKPKLLSQLWKMLPHSRSAIRQAYHTKLKRAAAKVWQKSPWYECMKWIDLLLPSDKFMKQTLKMLCKHASLLFQLWSGHYQQFCQAPGIPPPCSYHLTLCVLVGWTMYHIVHHCFIALIETLADWWLCLSDPMGACSMGWAHFIPPPFLIHWPQWAHVIYLWRIPWPARTITASHSIFFTNLCYSRHYVYYFMWDPHYRCCNVMPITAVRNSFIHRQLDR